MAPSVAREQKEATNAKKPVPQARLIPVEAPIADTTMSRSSPWTQSRTGGAARATPPEPDLEITTIEPATTREEPVAPTPPKRVSQPVQPQALVRTEQIRRSPQDATVDDPPPIAKVGFSRPPAPKLSSLPSAAPRQALQDASQTEQIPVGDLRSRGARDPSTINLVSGGQTERSATEDTIDAARQTAQKLTRQRMPSGVQTLPAGTRRDEAKLPSFPDARLKKPAPPVRSAVSEELLANKPVQQMDPRLRAAREEGLTPHVPFSTVTHEDPPVSETRLAAPGELAGREKNAAISETMAAPGELAGLLKKDRTNPAQPAAPRANPTTPPAPRMSVPATIPVPTASQAKQPIYQTTPKQPAIPKQATSPKQRVPDPEMTLAAPGDLAGLIDDLGVSSWGGGKEEMPSMPPQPRIDLNVPVALPGPPMLEESLPMRQRTEPEAKFSGSMRSDQTDPGDTTGDFGQMFRAPAARSRTETEPYDDGLLSMPGSSVPHDTLIPQRVDSLMQGIAVNAQTAAVPQPGVRFRVPGLWRRLAADLIDGTVLALLVIAPLAFGLFGKQLADISWIDPDDVSAALVAGTLALPAIAFAILVLVASGLGHGLAGRSLGKLVCGLELVEKNSGMRPSILRTIIRAVLGLVGLLAFGMGYLWLFVDRKSRTLHDVLAGTVAVVSSSRREA